MFGKGILNWGIRKAELTAAATINKIKSVVSTIKEYTLGGSVSAPKASAPTSGGPSPTSGALPSLQKGSNQFSTKPSKTAITFVKTSDDRIKRLFLKEKQDFLNQVESHPISKEIKDQIYGTSSLLSDGGSLYAFIGFRSPREPISELIDFLNEKIQYVGFVGATTSPLRLVYQVKFPDEVDFSKDSRLAGDGWEIGNPWPLAIENGIPGYQYFLELNAGRSEGGIQIKNQKRSADFRPSPYITPMLNDFKQRLKKISSKFEIL